ncbi:hypothetical protein NUH88_17165 [Nisaea acidiphila]|uniref:Uncharacterized protein n=1 Tax=Nisaea acidiphila TaxID=1862145 RepID=A0A9J7ARB6_9PROT|nr:hypothetical protein [Nisaea acidiphila]UUX49121.1 hypothetical protein NUH88_17165 [Nisaea acidiphila]
MAKNIVNFPIKHSRAIGGEEAVSIDEADLFGVWGRKDRRFVFFNIEELDQERLSNLLMKNSVSCVFDFRAKPVFENPKFHHREVIEYFTKYHVSYFDSALLTHVSGADENDFSVEKLKIFLSSRIISGLVVFIVDERLVKGINKNSIRGFIKHNNPDFLEVSPSSVIV